MLDKRTADFIASVIRSLPRELPKETMEGWTGSPTMLGEALHFLCVCQLGGSGDYETYLTPFQMENSRRSGVDVKEHLEMEGLIRRAFSVRDDLVLGWFEDPKTFPDNLKRVKAYLWGTMRTVEAEPEVMFLVWNGERVDTGYTKIKEHWGIQHPALLKPAS